MMLLSLYDDVFHIKRDIRYECHIASCQEISLRHNPTECE